MFLLYLVLMISKPVSEDIDIAGLYDPTQPFEVIDQHEPKDGKLRFTIGLNDPRHARILSWLELNEQSWTPTHNTHAGLVIIYQQNFRLLLYRNSDFAVVIITDEKDVSRYFKKDLKTGGLSFLDE